MNKRAALIKLAESKDRMIDGDGLPMNRYSRTSSTVTTPNVESKLKRKKREFGGMGGHMIMGLVHKMIFYDEMMRKALGTNNHDQYRSLKAGRSHFMKRTRDRLAERGYYGPFPVPIIAS